MDYHCRVPHGVPVNAVIPLEFRQGKLTYSQCERYVNSSMLSNETVPCDEWFYDTSELQSSIVSEVIIYTYIYVKFNLVK